MTAAGQQAATFVATHRRVLETALRNEVVSAEQDAHTMRDVARRLRSGEAIPLYAAGESGAVGADRLAEGHDARGHAAELALTALENLQDLEDLVEEVGR